MILATDYDFELYHMDVKISFLKENLDLYKLT